MYILKRKIDISIHAPVKGATCNRCAAYWSIAYFNPRTREGCDNTGVLDYINNNLISIHAPVKGATLMAAVSQRNGIQFQSTHP